MDYQRRIDDRLLRRLKPVGVDETRAGSLGDAGQGAVQSTSNVVYLSTGPELRLLFDVQGAGLQPASWYNTAWTKRVLVLAGLTGTQEHSAFQVYLSEANMPTTLFSTAKADGSDLRVCSADGTTLLSHDLVHFNAAGTMEVHVRTPLAAGPDPTPLWLYYGNPAASAPSAGDKAAVWSEYLQVMHLGETAGAYADSSTNGQDGTDHGTARGQAGQLYATGACTFDGTADWIGLLGLTSAVQTYTFSMWCASTQNTTPQKYLLDVETGRLALAWNTGVANKIGWYDGAMKSVAAPPSDGAYHHIVYVLQSGVGGTLYIDGVPYTGTYTPLNIGGAAALGARYNGGSLWYAGSLDEFRILEAARSAAWVSTELANQSDPATFATCLLYQEQ